MLGFEGISTPQRGRFGFTQARRQSIVSVATIGAGRSERGSKGERRTEHATLLEDGGEDGESRSPSPEDTRGHIYLASSSDSEDDAACTDAR